MTSIRVVHVDVEDQTALPGAFARPVERREDLLLAVGREDVLIATARRVVEHRLDAQVALRVDRPEVREEVDELVEVFDVVLDEDGDEAHRHLAILGDGQDLADVGDDLIEVGARAQHLEHVLAAAVERDPQLVNPIRHVRELLAVEQRAVRIHVEVDLVLTALLHHQADVG